MVGKKGVLKEEQKVVLRDEQKVEHWVVTMAVKKVGWAVSWVVLKALTRVGK